MNPWLVNKYNDNFELIVVQAEIHGKKVRIISGYGPQETWPESERLPFFVALEEEILNSRLNGIPVIIQMDANSKLGPELIKKDPHPQSVNGHILAGNIERHKLVVANGLNDKCKGYITRKRITVSNTEQSIIDFLILSDEIAEMLDTFLVDELQQYALVGYTKTKKGVKKNVSDHMPLITTLESKWSLNTKHERIEMYSLLKIKMQNN